MDNISSTTETTGYIHVLEEHNPVQLELDDMIMELEKEEEEEEEEEAKKRQLEEEENERKRPAHPHPNHPSYLTMIKGALLALNKRMGSSKAAILNYMAKNYELGDNLHKVNSHLRLALKKAAEQGEIQQTKGHGASGSFKLGAAHNTKSGKKTPEVKKTGKAATAKKMDKVQAKESAKKTAAKKKPVVKESKVNKKPKQAAKKMPRAKIAKTPRAKITKKPPVRAPRASAKRYAKKSARIASHHGKKMPKRAVKK